MAKKFDEMHTDIKRVVNVVEDIQEYVFRSKRSPTLLSSDRQQMPLKPEVFHGRDDLVKDIVQLFLQEETSRVCVLGPGGMGKTAVSLAVVESPLIKERFPGENCVWVPCIEATSATPFLETLCVQLQILGDKQAKLERIISELNASKEPRLILLDNFETPWNAPGRGQKQVGDILRKIATLSHIAILITMRGRYPPCDKAIKWQSMAIQSTDEVACLHIYHDIDPDSENDPDVARLLAALGHMPFAVTLMANLGKQGQSKAKELLDAWYKRGPDILDDRHEESMNRSISLSVDSDLVKQNSNALLLLKILSLLPAGTTKENLHWWAPALEISMIPSAIATLFNAALLVENKCQDSNSLVLFVLPVVQSFMQQQDRITEEIRKDIHLSCCKYVLAHACPFDDPTFSAKSKVLVTEDTNIQSIFFSPTMDIMSTDGTIDALIAFSWHRCYTKPNLDIVNLAMMAAKESGVEKYIALAVWCLGRTYYQLGDHDPSYNYLQEAYQLFNNLPSDDVEAQRLGSQCGIDLVDVACMVLQNESEVVSLARLAQDVEMKCATLMDDLIHGQSLVLLGTALDVTKQQQEALVHLEHARVMLKAIGNTHSLAEACQIIARVHYREGRLPEAMDAIQEAWKHIESSASPSGQSDIALEFVVILFSTDRDTEAWPYIEIALMKATYIGDQLQVANVLEYMGYGYLRRGDYQNAYGAYEAAAEKYFGTTEDWCVEKCKGNMARIKQKQENTSLVIGFHRHGYDIDTSPFYPPIQASASDMPISIC